MNNWNDIYKKTLRDICEANSSNFENIVEIERPKFESDLVENENANFNSLFRFKLDENASLEDKKKFVEYIYNYIGEDIYDYIPREGNDMEEKRIRDLLKQYGAEDAEIENFMNDLNDDFNYLDYIDKLKLTEKGKDIIAKAPELKKDELKKLILDYLKEEE